MGWTGRDPAPDGTQSAPRACQEKERRDASHVHRSRSDYYRNGYGQEHLYMIGLDKRGAIVLREKVSRGRIASRLANMPSCLIGIERVWRHTMLLVNLPRSATIEAGAADVCEAVSAGAQE